MTAFDLRADLEQRRATGLYRRRRVLQGPQTVEAVVDGRRCLAFCSNDYLGLANHPAVKEAMKRGVDRYGVGGGASHLINGHSAAHHELEEALADFVGRERAVLFSTGYMANLGAVGALMRKGDAVYEDRLNHASLLDAGLLCRAQFHRYGHGEVAELERRLEPSQRRRQLIVTDGVFSMDGDLAPLPELAGLAAQRDAWLMVDDAHGIGVLGEKGAGTLERFGLGADRVPVLVGTLGKALGTAGAFVAGSEGLAETLIQQARTYIYTTAMPPAVAVATLASLKLVREEAWRRDRLQQLVRRFRQGAEALGFRLMPSETPIQPILIGDPEKALRLSDALWERGLLITAIRPPTVPRGSARLRVTFSAAHSESQVDRLLDALEELRGEFAGG
ncbi:MAG: 8-amino-7-oxononanoate synthase [Gammaproteobacteria bacterium]